MAGGPGMEKMTLTFDAVDEAEPGTRRQHFRWVSVGRVGQNANSLRLVGRFGMISIKTAKRPMGCTGHFFLKATQDYFAARMGVVA